MISKHAGHRSLGQASSDLVQRGAGSIPNTTMDSIPNDLD